MPWYTIATSSEYMATLFHLYTLHPGQEASASNPFVHPTRTSYGPHSCLPAPAAALPGWLQRSTCAHCAAVHPTPASCPAEGQTPQQSCRVAQAGQARGGRRAGGGGGGGGGGRQCVEYGRACDGFAAETIALHPFGWEEVATVDSPHYIFTCAVMMRLRLTAGATTGLAVPMHSKQHCTGLTVEHVCSTPHRAATHEGRKRRERAH